MKLVFNRPHKSISRFPSIELPSFTILTGVNGAGKSHLLEAIDNNCVSIEGVPPNQPNGSKQIRRFDWSNLIPQDTGAFSGSQISSEQSGFWNEILQHRQQPTIDIREQLRQFNCIQLETMSIGALWRLGPTQLSQMGLDNDRANQVHQFIQQNVSNASQNIANLFVRNDPQNRPRLLSAITTSAIPLVALEEDEFYRAYPNTWHPIDLFQQSFARLFSAYQRRWLQNKVKFIGQAEDASLNPLSDIEFLEKHGKPPWIFLNEVLETAELDFRINEPYKWDDRPYEPILTDVKRGIKIKFNDLSSGERILMSFALCLYHAGDLTSGADFPRVLLFDEIDAPLHPSMTRSLLRTIQMTLVEKHNIQVVLTTHSPSTVALAQDDAIHVMHKLGSDRIKRTTKDMALGILTSGVPTLSVNYENRRQVFVESKYDVEYFSELYQKCKTRLSSEVSLMFISSGVGGSGNCDQVRSVVNNLSTGGNRTILGIIDWDGSNKRQGNIFVLGEEERYSIENFLLDPVLLGLLLIREKFYSQELLGVHVEVRYVEMHSQPDSILQAIANFVVDKVAAHHQVSDQSSKTNFYYVGGKQVVVPKWFAELQGHSLEDSLKSAFPQLQRYRNEPDLKSDIIRKVIDDFPELMPTSIVELFRQMQTGGS